MTNYIFSPEGEIREGQIYPLLYHIYKNNISGVLAIKTENYEKKIFIRDRRIIFASSDQKMDTFSEYLLNKQLITREIYTTATQYMAKNKKRFGRALIELGYFSYDQIWTWIPAHLISIVYSLFNIKYGAYRFIEQHEDEMNIENIVLDLDILCVIVEAIRHFKSDSFLKKQFESITTLYPTIPNTDLLPDVHFKPYEVHIFNIVRRESVLTKILEKSELLENDTLRLLFLFMVMEVISMEKHEHVTPTPLRENENNTVNRSGAFASFEEALKYYNGKYELIYRVMMKEIGPICMSILHKSIEDIMENLPTYLRKIQLKSDGTILEEPILKSLWYNDFDQHIGDFLRGLEEILYTEIFAVRKHLGLEYEQQVLKWIKGIGN